MMIEVELIAPVPADIAAFPCIDPIQGRRWGMRKCFIQFKLHFIHKCGIGVLEGGYQPRFVEAKHFPEKRQDEREHVVGGIIPLIEGAGQKGLEADTAWHISVNLKNFSRSDGSRPVKIAPDLTTFAACRTI